MSALFPTAKSDPVRRVSPAHLSSCARTNLSAKSVDTRYLTIGTRQSYVRSLCFLLSTPFFLLFTLFHRMQSRRDFLSLAGKSLGLAALSSATISSLLK